MESDREFLFERIGEAQLGEDSAGVRKRALGGADLVVVFLSPAYLGWTNPAARGVEPAVTSAEGGLVAPVCWSRLTDRNDLGPYAAMHTFTPTADRDTEHLSAGELRGLDRLAAGRLDDEMASLHRHLARLLASPPAEPPVNALARNLAASDEPDPVTARAVRTQLDKGVGAVVSSAGPAVDVVDHLVGWATDGDRPYFVVFGEYGMGKTVAAQTLTRVLLTRRESDPSVPLPIYFDLRHLGTDVRKRDASLDELLADLIQRAWRTGSARVPVTPEDVITAVQRRRAVVIFDGLDEVLVHMSEQQGQGLLRELLRILPPQLVAGDGRRDAGKVLMTCRTHFFRTIRDQHTFFRPRTATASGRICTRRCTSCPSTTTRSGPIWSASRGPPASTRRSSSSGRCTTCPDWPPGLTTCS